MALEEKAFYFVPGPSQTNRVNLPRPIQDISMSIIMFRLSYQLKPVAETLEKENTKEVKKPKQKYSKNK